ncbi:MAG: hypothetical protein NVS3B20_12500 [Polyangiales bacterium]
MALEDTLGLIGTTIGEKYVVEAVVGEGGFAVVYRATHLLWQKPVALKVFKTMTDAAPSLREKLLQEFVQEGALLTELSARSASIVQARDIGTHLTPSGAWLPYMVLEWLEGVTLEALIEHEHAQPWPIERVLTLLEPIARALEIAHRRNIAHRDVKPANIFIVGDPDSDQMLIKLLDFGIAKVVQTAADKGFTKTSGLVTSFTPGYGAPEQFSRTHGATGPWTDVYALGLIVTELLTGKGALEGDDFIQLGMASADPARRPTPATLGFSLGADVDLVLEKALAVKPAARYQSAGDFWNGLRVAVGAGPMRQATTTPRADSAAQVPFAQTQMQPGGGGASPARFGRTTDGVSNALHQADQADQANQAGVPRALRPNVAPSEQPVDTKGRSKSSATYGILAVAGVIAIVGAGIWRFQVGRFASIEKPSTPSPSPLTIALASASTSASSSTSTLAIAAKCGDGMASIPGGSFFMGSDQGEESEKPSHRVILSPFCMDLTEVTVSAYKACSDRGECKRATAEVRWPDIDDHQRKIYGPLCNIARPQESGDHPINCVDFEMAKNFCSAHNKRLPTEAEWEFAARGPDGRVYPWGDDPPDATRLNACDKQCVAWGKKMGVQVKAMFDGDDGYAGTAPVGRFPAGASRYGLLDVVGNVWEWTSDWEGPYTDVREAVTNPQGPKEGSERIVRGGAFNGSFASWVRPSWRYSFMPDAKSHAGGFRCAKSQPGT